MRTRRKSADDASSRIPEAGRPALPRRLRSRRGLAAGNRKNYGENVSVLDRRVQIVQRPYVLVIQI